MVRTSKNNKNGKGTQEFLSKPKLSIKKNKPQKVMQQFFPVIKPKREIPAKNFQGFPMEECEFDAEIGKHIYCPPCYGNKELTLCPQCLLRPCIVSEKWDDIMSFCGDIMVFEDHATDAMYMKTLDHVESLLVEIFGMRYARRNPMPTCVWKLVDDYYESVMKGRGESFKEQHPDDDLVEGALDSADFLTQQW